MRPYLGICAIVRNEGAYIHEWLSYHRAIGVERFTLYDNGSTDNTLAEVARFGYPVDVIPWPGQAQQPVAYRDMLANRRHYADWVAFIDVDEFLMERGASVRQVLQAVPASCAAVYVHWLFFGSNGHNTKTPGGVAERFTRRSVLGFGPNRYGKSIVRMNSDAELITTHMIGQPGRILTPSRHNATVDDGGLQPLSDHGHIALAHYFTKSQEEWMTRRALGRPALPLNHPDAIRSVDQFRNHDRNDVIDHTVADVLERREAWACSGNEWLSALHLAA
jgi:glycosyltransferase involved in cell wall biosynthesis